MSGEARGSVETAELIERGLTAAGPGPVALAAPCALEPAAVEPYARDNRLAGVVADQEAADGASGLPAVGRWTSPERSRFALSRTVPRTLLFLGTASQIGGRMLVECLRRGVRRIVHLDPQQADFVEMRPLRALKGRAVPLLLARFGRMPLAFRVGERALALSGLSYEEGFAELLKETRFLHLPPEAFDPDAVLLCSGTLGPGGAERQISYCARGVAREGRRRVGVACVDLTPPVNDFYAAAIREAGAAVRQIPAWPAGMDDPRLSAFLQRFAARHAANGLHAVARSVLTHALLFREERPAIVHSWMDASNVVAGLAAVIVGVPRVVMSGRSVAPDHFPLFQPHMRAAYRAILAGTDAVLLNNSAAGAKDYGRWLDIDPGRIPVIRNGFEFPEDRPEAVAAELRRALGWAPETVVLGNILRFTEEKRPQLWLEVAIAFVRAAPHHRAVAFGGGHMRPELAQRIEAEGLSDRIRLPGTTRDAWASLAALDIFLLTSRMEGLPNVLVEAQAMGVPVVAIPVGGVPETLLPGKTGILVERDGAAAIAAACIALAADPERRRAMGAAGSRYVRDCFSAERMVKDVLEIYRGAPVPVAA